MPHGDRSACFFLAPMLVMLVIALQHGVLSGEEGWTLTNFSDVLSDPLYRDVALTTFADRDDRDDHPARDRDPARVRDRLQGGEVRAAAPALPRSRRRTQPDGADLRLADAPRPRGDDQLGADGDRADQRSDRRAALQQVRGDRGALDELSDLHRDTDLRLDEGNRPQHVRGRSRPRGRLVHHCAPSPAYR